MSLVDSTAVFEGRARTIGLTDDVIQALGLRGWTTHATFAFAVATQPGADEQAFADGGPLVALLRKRSKAAQDESHLRAESPLKRMRLDAGSKPVEGQASFQTGEDKGSPHDFQAGFQEVDNASEPAPQPLRSDHFPNGLPWLKGVAKLKHLPEQCRFQYIHACMYGSRRRKSTALLLNFTAPNLQSECDDSHSHLPWGMVDQQDGKGLKFSTSLETEYPLQLSRHLAVAFMEALNAQGKFLTSHNVQEDQIQRIGAGTQPRGVKSPILMSEFKCKVDVTSHDVEVPQHIGDSVSFPFQGIPINSKLIASRNVVWKGVDGEKQQGQKSTFGVFFSPLEFFKRTLELEHPLDTPQLVDRSPSRGTILVKNKESRINDIRVTHRGPLILLDNRAKLALRDAFSCLAESGPRSVQAWSGRRPLVIFTDGACEENGELVTHGAVLFDPVSSSSYMFGDKVPIEWLDQWRLNARLDVQLQCLNWYSRVPSKSNISDDASRLQFAALERLGDLADFVRRSDSSAARALTQSIGDGRSRRMVTGDEQKVAKEEYEEMKAKNGRERFRCFGRMDSINTGLEMVLLCVNCFPNALQYTSVAVQAAGLLFTLPPGAEWWRHCSQRKCYPQWLCVILKMTDMTDDDEAETCVLDSDGRTAIDWAERRQQHLVAETLHRHERLHRLVNDSTAAAHAELNSKLFNAEAHAAQLARDLAAKLPGRPARTSSSQAESSELAAEKRLNSVEEQLADKNAELLALEAMAQHESEQRDRADKVEERCEELEVRCKSLQELEERLLKSEMRHQETESCLQELQDQSKGLLTLQAKQQLSEESMLRLNSVEEQLADKNAELLALEAMAQNESEQRDRADKVEERCEELEVRCKSLQELEERLLKSEMRHQETESCLQELQDQSKGLLTLEAKQQLSEESMLRLLESEQNAVSKLELAERATEALRVDLEAAKSEAETMRCKAENAEEEARQAQARAAAASRAWGR
ncbi:unnamed protein product [Cladocopium goreaui]|uniref:Uncharacterized protein n=1 Tax=Cladocopium goreaui TaxID=2562237 RepID=A0A9P1DUP6_9DINO|nr:unnamed protein product [Cladocopium goreaui]